MAKSTYLYAPQINEITIDELTALVVDAALMATPHFDTPEAALAAGADFAERLGSANRVFKVTVELEG